MRTPVGAVGLALTGAFIAVAALAGPLAPFDPFESVGPPLQAPSAAHLMGTDNFGRDVLSGVVYGARTSLLVAVGATAMATVVGIAVGAVSGYRGGLVDDLLMRFTEFVQVVPRFFLAVVVVALFGPGLDRLILLLGLTSWPWLARTVRAEILSLKAREFVESARAVGRSGAGIVVHELLPNALPATVVVVSANAAGVILLEASLGFIGLSDPGWMSWGYLASRAQAFLRVAWWMSVFPGGAMVLAILGLNLLADAVNDPRRPRSSRGAPAGPGPARPDGMKASPAGAGTGAPFFPDRRSSNQRPAGAGTAATLRYR